MRAIQDKWTLREMSKMKENIQFNIFSCGVKCVNIALCSRCGGWQGLWWEWARGGSLCLS